MEMLSAFLRGALGRIGEVEGDWIGFGEKGSNKLTFRKLRGRLRRGWMPFRILSRERALIDLEDGVD